MYQFTHEEIDLDAIRRRFAKMTDEALNRYGKEAASLAAQPDSRETFRVQLTEARAEWRRRHPK